tara:strand:- start:365 stop:1015 length:651 start_codon:yes stop_codon:yes gene_type:complete
VINKVSNRFILNEVANLNKLVLLDLDDTVVEADDIYIYRQFPGEEEVALTPAEYRNERVTDDTKQYYDYRDFADPKSITDSIMGGEPIVTNLSVMDELINRGYQIGILTARGHEDTVYDTLREWLMYRDKNGQLVPIGDRLDRNLVYAVNDAVTASNLTAVADFDKKAEVINGLLDQYDEIIFLDDDIKNLKAVKKLKSTLESNKANKLFVMKAKI